MFSVQIQQAARLAHVGKLDSEGQSMVRRTLGIEAHELASRYVWYNVDPAKASLLSDDFDAKAFLLWSARMTVKHPVDTLSSWLGVEQGWLSLRTGSDANMAVSGYAGEDNSLQPLFASASRTDAKAHGEIEDDMTPGAHAVSGWYSFLAKAPVIGLLFGKALWSSMLPGYMLFAACRAEKGRRLRALAMIAPVTLSFLFLFLSPLSVSPESTRYALPLVVTLPFLLLIPAIALRASHESHLPPRHGQSGGGMSR